MGANITSEKPDKKIRDMCSSGRKIFDRKEHGWPVSRQPAMRHHCVSHASVTFNF